METVPLLTKKDFDPEQNQEYTKRIKIAIL